MSRWKIILARTSWALSGILFILGIIFTIGLVQQYGEAAGALNLALQAALIWAPPSILCALAGFLLQRSEKKHSRSEE